jgi:hypothetical protein
LKIKNIASVFFNTGNIFLLFH